MTLIQESKYQEACEILRPQYNASRGAAYWIFPGIDDRGPRFSPLNPLLSPRDWNSSSRLTMAQLEALLTFTRAWHVGSPNLLCTYEVVTTEGCFVQVTPPQLKRKPLNILYHRPILNDAPRLAQPSLKGKSGVDAFMGDWDLWLRNETEDDDLGAWIHAFKPTWAYDKEVWRPGLTQTPGVRPFDGAHEGYWFKEPGGCGPEGEGRYAICWYNAPIVTSTKRPRYKQEAHVTIYDATGRFIKHNEYTKKGYYKNVKVK